MKTKIIYLFLSFFISLAVYAEGGGGVKMVYDESLKNQFASTVYSQWKFSPKWFYELLYKKYMEEYGNTDDFLEPLTEHAENSKNRVINAHNEIDVVYKQEIVKWNDRTIDREYELVENDINDLRSLIEKETGKFLKNKISVSNAEVIYKELSRIDSKLKIVIGAHLENEKRRSSYQEIIGDYKNLFRVCSDLNTIYTLNLSKK